MVEDVGRLLLRGWQAMGAGNPTSVYDEVLHTLVDRVAVTKALDKADIGALVLWKRISAQTTWAKALMLTSDAEVRAATGAAYERANDLAARIPEAGQAAREALRDLPGMGGTGSLASAVLLALAPSRMAVWDRRVGASLLALGRYPTTRKSFYAQYLTTTLELAEAMRTVSPDDRTFLPRDVDLALFGIAGTKKMLDEARHLASGHAGRPNT